MIFIQVLTAMKNKYQLCRFQNWLIFWCLLFLPFHLNNGLGKWDWLTKSCQRVLSFLTPTSPEMYLELFAKLVLPLTNSYLLTFAKAWSQSLSHVILTVSSRTVTVERRLAQRWGSFLSRGACTSLSAVPPFAAFADTLYKKNQSVRAWTGNWVLGVVARHSSPLKPSDQKHSGLASNSEDGFKYDLFVFLLWGELALCSQSSCARLCCVRFQITLARQMSLAAGFGALIHFTFIVDVCSLSKWRRECWTLKFSSVCCCFLFLLGFFFFCLLTFLVKCFC